MKKLLLLPIVLFMMSCGFTKKLHESEPETIVVELPKQSKEEIYVKANQWLITLFKNAESVIQFSDKEYGVLSGKYIIATLVNGNSKLNDKYLYALLNIYIKESKAKIEIYPDPFFYYPNNPYSEYTPDKLMKDTDFIFTSFETYMSEPLKNNW